MDTANNKDIFGSLLLNVDQARFKKDVMNLANSKIPKFSKAVKLIRGIQSGYLFSDYVLTVNISRDRRSVDVYRNRDGILILSIVDTKVVSIHWEYIFIEDHLRNILKEENEARRN